MTSVIHRARIIIIGDANTGKTSISDRYVNNFFNEKTEYTVGIEYFTRSFSYYWNGRPVNLQMDIWDTAGQECFKAITLTYYRDTDGAILVFDLNNPESFDNIKDCWFKEIHKYCPPDISVILVGNKLELVEKDSPLSKSAEAFAKENNIPYFQVSAKTGNGINSMFDTLVSYFRQNTDKLARPQSNLSLITMDDSTQSDNKPVVNNRCCYL